MFRYVCVAFFSLLGFFTVLSTTVAADSALVIGNRNYRHADWIYDANKVLSAAQRLRRAGYSVMTGRDLSAGQTRQVLGGLLAELEEAERVVIILSGHFVHSGKDTWFVPVDASAPDLASIGYQGLSLNTLLELAALKPGRAAIFLGRGTRQIDVGHGLTAGIGVLDIPQGVFVATGTPKDIDLTVRRDFLGEGTGFASALANAPDSVQGQGFISDSGALVPDQGPDYDPEVLLEDGYWQAVQDMNTQRAVISYLNAYPNGRYAAEAQEWLDARTVKTPQDEAREAEEALNLSRTARRAIQEDLSLLGYDTRGIDGIFGPGTRGAIRNWQRDQGVEAFGYLKRGQITKLNRQAERRAAELAEEARKKQLELEAADRAFWRSSGGAEGRERGLRRYLRRYPDGLFADVALIRLEAIEQQKRDNARAAERDAWDYAGNENTIAAYEAYLQSYPKGVFANEAKARLADLREKEARKAEIAAAKQAEADLDLNVLARTLIEGQLIALGFDAGAPDGKFDKDTRRAIRRFQRARGFPVTGYLDRQSLVRLIAEAG